MKFLDNVIEKLPEYKSILTAVKNKPCAVAATGLTSIHKAHLIHCLSRKKSKKAFVVASDEHEAQVLANDLSSMGSSTCFYPTRDFIFSDISGQSREYEHQRLNVLSKLLKDECDVVIACIDALSQYTIPPKYLKKATLSLESGQQISIEEAIEALLLNGYEHCEQVEGAGQFAHRGGILDFFMPDSEYPVRVEFWGDEVDTINAFDAETQRRTDYIEKITITPSAEVIIKDNIELADKIEHKISLLKGKNTVNAKEILQQEADNLRNGLKLGSADKFINLIYDETATLLDYVDGRIIYISEQTKITDRQNASAWQISEDLKDYFEKGTLCRGFETYSLDKNQVWEYFGKQTTVFLDNFTHGTFPLPINEMVNFTAKQLSLWGGSVKILCDDLEMDFNKKSSFIILAGTKRSADSLYEELKEKNYPVQLVEDIEAPQPNNIYIMEGSLSAGFEYPAAHFSLLSHGIVFAQHKKRRSKPKNAQQIYSLAELNIGDYVVHSTHGIGTFCGIHKLDMQGVIKDYIKIEYAKKDVLYVPVTQLDLVSKYIGPRENSGVRLSKLGGNEWQKSKARVRSAVKDMAKELTKLYAQRMEAKGHQFPADNEWQRDFESHFEYEETTDQLRCIDEIKSDMERTAPMDRLLCGDVGFGKTEVALRSAFKCVTDSKQCALLCPTTILAWQHYQTAIRRFEGFPVRIELLSRFRTPKQQTEIIKQLKRGEIDMIIGTHRLVQKDVEFRDLGLVIIDEEQRFGVAQKERFKELCKNVDVLTLSATPIPRTLNMAMSGIRDMSVLEEAPQDRHPVQTYVLEYDESIINEAIRRELRRGGQVFYLHNKVETISQRAAKIKRQIPEAKIGIGHGKMNEQELSEVWRQMLEQEINVLVCTTIIETGVDIPNANTLIIDYADHMGLSQLHQLRGRVGRSSRRAYAYFTFMKNKVLSEVSEKRLAAIKEFTEFGSGFKIAMRDLEIRGAGNILGAQQHGHMEDVGYDMYLKLLAEAVSEERGEENVTAELECLVDIQIQAHIPENYIQSLSQRIDIYRRISDIRNKDDAADVIDELVDRFGDVPQSVMGLIQIALVRNSASTYGIYEIKQQSSNLLMYIKQVNNKKIADIMSKLKGRALLNAGNKPYISVKIQPDSSPIKTLNEIFS